jgi:hypothetical protein
VAEAVHAELVAAGGNLEHCLGVELAVERLDEEGRDQPECVEVVEQAREGYGNGGVAPELSLAGPTAPLQLAGLA